MKIISNSKYKELYKKAIKVYLDRFLGGRDYGLDYELDEAIIFYKIQGLPLKKIFQLRNEDVEKIKKAYNNVPAPNDMTILYSSEIKLISQIGDFLSFSLYYFLKNNFIHIAVLHKSENKLIIELEFKQYVVKCLTFEKYTIGEANMYKCKELSDEFSNFVIFRDYLAKYLADFVDSL